MFRGKKLRNGVAAVDCSAGNTAIILSRGVNADVINGRKKRGVEKGEEKAKTREGRNETNSKPNNNKCGKQRLVCVALRVVIVRISVSGNNPYGR